MELNECGAMNDFKRNTNDMNGSPKIRNIVHRDAIYKPSNDNRS